jgi:regulation of enolase protein 1 (concanavalin A-like superfamily)
MRNRRRALTVVVISVLTASSGYCQFTSDDFNANNLKRSVWVYTDPQADGTLTLTGTGTPNAALSLAVPGDIEHQPWTGGIKVPRIMQPSANTDIQIEVKFLSPVNQEYQIQGILVEQDSTHFLRFDFSSDGSSTYLFAASFSGDYSLPTTYISLDSIATAGVSPIYLRITRLGNLWAVSTSLNGTSYSSPSPGNFTHVLTVRKVGLFVGNGAGNSGTVPPHTALVDYFFNSGVSNPPEDGGTVTDLTGPLAYNILSSPGISSLDIQWKTDESAQGIIQYGPTKSYGKSVSHADFSKTHALTVTGLIASTPYNYRVISTDAGGNKDTSANLTPVTLPASPPTLSIWYGTPQTFGKLGTPQRYVNILGSVYDSAGVDSLYYRLNNGPRVKLSFGPDTRRLQQPGDFNIDLSYLTLQPGANTLVVTAKNINGASATNTVTVNDNSSRVWPQPFTIGFANPSSLTDSAQVVDGKWGIGPGGIRTIELGYNRAIAIGDTVWDDYLVAAQFTVHGIDSTWETIRGMYGGPGLGIMMRWKGHTNDPVFDPPITQPLSGYFPLGAVGWYRWRNGYDSGLKNRWELIGNNLALRDQDTLNPLTYGKLYNLKMQVRTLPGSAGSYKLKAWADGQPEPTGWILEGQEELSDPFQGSVLLLANFVDVTFRKVTVIPESQIPPSITGATVTAGSRSAIVRWKTEPEAKSTLAYGLTTSYRDSVTESTLGTDHEAFLTALAPGATYHYRISAVDARGLSSSTGDLTFTTQPPAPASTLVSDEFNSGAINTSVWAVTTPNPPGGSSIGATGVEAFISLASGVAHDLWTNGNTVPRIMQSCNNTDFDVVAKFNTSVTGDLASYQVQGILVEEDVNNFVRVDFNSGTGDSVALFAASFKGGFSSPVTLLNKNLAPHGASPLFLRIIRETPVWSITYSFDGVTWRKGAVFTLSLAATKVGIFAANPGAIPVAFSALVDYFRVGAGTAAVPAVDNLPTEFVLSQNYPNPFNPSTNVRFALPERSHVTLEVFSALGQRVAVLADEEKSPGVYVLAFDGRNLSSGVYIYRLIAGGRVFQKKMLLVK